jgi:hypothetical protein
MVHRSDTPGDQNDDNSGERFFRGALLGLAVAMPMWPAARCPRACPGAPHRGRVVLRAPKGRSQPRVHTHGSNRFMVLADNLDRLCAGNTRSAD